jgi:hypothetical protein
MKDMYKLQRVTVLIFSLLFTVFLSVNGQTGIPDVLKNNSMKEQMKYIEEKTRIYENYRAIREDMFQQIKNNVSDTLRVASGKISELNNKKSILSHTIDSLAANLESTKTSLEETTSTKNSISILGIEVNKLTYNSIMWTIVAGLIAILTLGFLAFKRNLSVTLNTKKELVDLRNEFETYRKTTREAREKMSMAHFNELKKLRGE